MAMFRFILVCILIIMGLYIIISDALWRRKPMQNFMFRWRGKNFWYSRSCAVTNFVFCKNTHDEWCVLANQRGSGCPDYQGYWNVPCGYLDFDENGEEAAQRETFEETSLFVAVDKIKFLNVNTKPSANRQNVTLRYVSILEDENCDTFMMADDYSEKDEIAAIKWIPIKEVDNYLWAFRHKEMIKEISSEKFE